MGSLWSSKNNEKTNKEEKEIIYYDKYQLSGKKPICKLYRCKNEKGKYYKIVSNSTYHDGNFLTWTMIIKDNTQPSGEQIENHDDNKNNDWSCSYIEFFDKTEGGNFYKARQFTEALKQINENLLQKLQELNDDPDQENQKPEETEEAEETEETEETEVIEGKEAIDEIFKMNKMAKKAIDEVLNKDLNNKNNEPKEYRHFFDGLNFFLKNEYCWLKPNCFGILNTKYDFSVEELKIDTPKDQTSIKNRIKRKKKYFYEQTKEEMQSDNNDFETSDRYKIRETTCNDWFLKDNWVKNIYNYFRECKPSNKESNVKLDDNNNIIEQTLRGHN